MKNLHKVKQLARNIRRSAEKAYGGKEPDLGGWCTVTSQVLFLELKKLGIKSRLVAGQGHCFVMYGNYVIDITATQFIKCPKVVIKPINKLPQEYWWNIQSSIHTTTQFNKSNAWYVSMATAYDSKAGEWQKRYLNRNK